MLLVFCSTTLTAQTQGPVLSPYYRKMVDEQRSRQMGDTLLRKNSLNHAMRLLNQPLGRYVGVKRVHITDTSAIIKTQVQQELAIGGGYSGSWEIRRPNRQPALSNTYAQGRNNTWQGAETGELFSYGPRLSLLEFDGSAYDYDRNGRLVPAGNGNGSKAPAYDNNILRTATAYTQTFDVNAAYMRDYQKTLYADVKLMRSDEHIFIDHHTNDKKSMLLTLGGQVRKVQITGKYQYREDRFSNSNRNGFLNHAYQYSLLTPVSFQNAQHSQLSYSPAADNPLFLLRDNGHFYRGRQRNAGLEITKKEGPFTFGLTQSVESINEAADESYKSGTAGFPDGALLQRERKDQSYFGKATARYDVKFGDHLLLAPTFNYIISDKKSEIIYQPSDSYHYHRTTSDIQPGFYGHYRIDRSLIVLEAGNRFYLSNTAASNRNLLPFVRTSWKNIKTSFGQIELKAGYTASGNEAPLNRSFAHLALTRLQPGEINSYLPVIELTSYKGAAVANHHYWDGGLDLQTDVALHFYAYAYSRNVKDDVFAVWEGNELRLRNLADHRENGIELGVDYRQWWGYSGDRFDWKPALSFTKTTSKVTRVNDGYAYTPIAGFSTLSKAIVKGAPLGAIVGSSWLRNAAGEIVVGADGFPMVNNTLSVIGNPIPDFLMKFNQEFHWKMFSAHVDLQWQQGGDVWNGTLATLDYYGRSAGSASARDITGYIFPGVKEDGHPNDIPVSFHNAAAPLEQNRWVRYGVGGVGESYMQKATHLRMNTLSVGYRLLLQRYRNSRYVEISSSVRNVLLWSAYKGSDPSQLLQDMDAGSGLDYFNLPSLTTYALNFSIAF